MKILKVVLPAAVLAAGIAITLVPVHATPALAKKEKKGCSTCHVSAKSKDLNKTGECYKDSKTLDGCPEPKK